MKEDNCLGCGSYGTVIRTEINNVKYAVKVCDLNDSGLPDIIEPAIMLNCKHKNLNHAYQVTVNSKSMMIVQDIAIMDLLKYRELGNATINYYWYWQICQAVNYLHDHNLIHGDLKCSNILLFPDNIVKLTDFSFSVKVWYEGLTYSHKVCTFSHRPPECHLNQAWDKKLDIWSLGCTFYEFEHYDLLFHINQRITKNETKEECARNAINAIYYWSKTINGADDYLRPYITNNQFYEPKTGNISSYILNMLVTNPSLRPSIKKVLAYPIFHNYQSNHSTTSRYLPENNKMIKNEHELNRILFYLAAFTGEEVVINISVYLYSKCLFFLLPERKKIIVCMCLAYKLLTGKLPHLDPKTVKLFKKNEERLCDYLGYNLISL